MKTLNIREARAELGRLDALLEDEGEIIITRRGRPIARIQPMRQRRPRPTHAELRAAMPRLDVGSEVLVRQDRDER